MDDFYKNQDEIFFNNNEDKMFPIIKSIINKYKIIINDFNKKIINKDLINKYQNQDLQIEYEKKTLKINFVIVKHKVKSLLNLEKNVFFSKRNSEYVKIVYLPCIKNYIDILLYFIDSIREIETNYFTVITMFGFNFQEEEEINDLFKKEENELMRKSVFIEIINEN